MKEPTIASPVSIDTDDKPITCKLNSRELRQRKEVVLAALKKQLIERNELSNGYSYKFNGTDETLDCITSFIKTERLCCEFFNFKLSVTNDSFILLEISGAEGAKKFITS